ncbi:MAG: lipid-A-disaccharide synthase [Woeseiaceae bacterium]|nr:lipid-A-disaccharide synthase [Woeseiaceae bacterium]
MDPVARFAAYLRTRRGQVVGVKFAFVAGEASGDLLGAGLIEALRARVPDAEFEGVAGPEMCRAGCNALADSEALAVMGLVEPLKEIPRLLKLRRSLVARWITAPPDVFIGIDAPDFNLGLELQLKRAGVRTVHYVSPSVWAWRQRRIRKIRKATDRVLCILPFEPEFYREHGVDAVFVGHPKADLIPDSIDTAAVRNRIGMDTGRPVVAVLPGSRLGEVERLGSIFAEAAQRIDAAVPGVQFVTPVASQKLRAPIERQLRDAGVTEKFLLLEKDSESAMMSADVVLLASGTAALESALYGKATVAAYKVAGMTAAIVRTFGLLKIDRFTLPNLLTKVPYIPEFIQENATPQALAEATVELLRNTDRRSEIERRFAKLRSELAMDANQRAAEAVLDLADNATIETL